MSPFYTAYVPRLDTGPHCRDGDKFEALAPGHSVMFTVYSRMGINKYPILERLVLTLNSTT